MRLALDDDLRLARAASEAALATEGVHALGTGRYAEAATYGPGEKVVGVVVNPNEVRVHIIARYPPPEPLPALAERIRERVAQRAQGRATTVVVEDVEVSPVANL
ncbi:MAG: hypothetical protein AVDCRST_MAG28-1202 [uncultured Rubrobacteraceae bacterium]|uniref:Asp23/Gls24 family envelope stress response protein n=1 Tax=uncultured Rubrobacteraceae bacterium TaxID=349277 RepID=A0A6J4QSK7_9ACTN|nr:MAG: hypothetical protein AVDCRST_MAG28-1202 [uncultured Rubrobacteraceae bacterium]